MESLRSSWGEQSRSWLYSKLEEGSNRSVKQYELEGYDSACRAFNVARTTALCVTAVFFWLVVGTLPTGMLVPVACTGVFAAGFISTIGLAVAGEMFIDISLSEEDQLDLVQNLIKKIETEMEQVSQEEDPARYQKLEKLKKYLVTVRQTMEEIIQSKNFQDHTIETFGNGNLINFWPPNAPPLLYENPTPRYNSEPPSYESLYPQQDINPPVNRYNRNDNY